MVRICLSHVVLVTVLLSFPYQLPPPQLLLRLDAVFRKFSERAMVPRKLLKVTTCIRSPDTSPFVLKKQKLAITLQKSGS